MTDWQLHPVPGARKGDTHVELHANGVAIVTPSRATAGQFRANVSGEQLVAHNWPTLRAELVRRGIAPPGRHAMRAIERWFVLPSESASGRLLRRCWEAQR